MPPHALIIDDDPFSIEVVARLLQGQHIDYTAVSDPTEVEGLLPQLAIIDVVFLDLEMPKIDGYQMLDYLREWLPNVPVIAHTVHLNEVNAARHEGFHSFIGKPVRMDRFQEQLSRILNGEAVWEVR